MLLRHAFLVLFGLVVLDACSQETLLRVHVQYDEAWNLTELEVSRGDKRRIVEPYPELLITPTSLEPFTLKIVGLVNQEHWAVGSNFVTPVKSKTAVATVVLERLACGDGCTLGAKSCAENGVIECIAAGECTQWSEAVLCPEEEPFCSLGECMDTCVDECSLSEVRCDGPNKVIGCGNNDDDTCNDWLSATECESGTTCSLGVCAAQCQDECQPGDRECSGNGVRECGDTDLDDCLEWGNAVPCQDGQSCSNATCQSGCQDECEAHLCEDGTFRECGQFDLDECNEYSSGETCARPGTCEIGTCTPSGCNFAVKECNDIPDDLCLNSNTLRRYAATTCSAGICDYPYTDVACECSGNQCSCDGLTCSPDTIANDVIVQDIDQDDVHVYFATTLGIMRWPKAGGEAEMFLPGAGKELAVAHDRLYYSETPGRRYVSKEAKAPANNASEISSYTGTIELEVFGGYLYSVEAGNNDIIRRSTSLGGEVQIARDEFSADSLFAAGDYVYWQNDAVIRWSWRTEERELFARGAVRHVVADEEMVYWTGRDSIWRQPVEGRTAEEFLPGQTGASFLAIEQDYLYWTNTDSIMRWPKAGGDPQPLATGQAGAKHIMVDDNYVYWATETSLLRLSRCACRL